MMMKYGVQELHASKVNTEIEIENMDALNERTATRPVLLSEAGRGIRLRNATHNNKTSLRVLLTPITKI